MAGRQIVVDLVSDERDFTRSMDRAAKSASGLESKLGDVGKAAQTTEERWSEVGDKFDDSEQPIIGLADVMDGLSTTMGLDGVNAAVQYTRGIADMASGIGNGLIPVMTQGVSKVKQMSAAFLASPTAKYKVALVAAAAATAYVAHETGNLNKVLDWSKEKLSNAIKGWDWVTGKLLGVVGASAAATASLEELQNQGKKLSGLDPLSNKNATSIGDWIGSQGIDPWERMRVTIERAREATAASEAYSSKMKAEADKAGRAAESAAKKAEAAEKKAEAAAEAALKKRFAKQEKILDSALKSWENKIKNAKAIRDQMKGLFGLDPEANAEGGLVAGLRKQASQMEAWVKKIAELRKKGFRESLVRDLVDRGPDSLADATELSHTSVRDVNKLTDTVKDLSDTFGRDEAKRRTGVDPNKPGAVKVTLNVKGSDTDLKNLIKKWVKEEGGGDVQVAFGKRK